MKIKRSVHLAELIFILAEKELKIRYKSAWLGWLWSVLNPLLLMIIFSLVFGRIIPVGIDNFPAFLLAALLPWFFLNFSLAQSTSSLVENSGLIKKSFFPYEAIPLSIVAANLFNFVLSLVLLLLFLLFFKIRPEAALIGLPLVILIQILFVSGICLAAAALHTVFRDVRYAIELLLVVWFYVTPVFYSLEMVPLKMRALFYLNPMTILVGMYRDILLYGRFPGTGQLFICLAGGAGFFLLGYLVFNINRKRFADLT